MRRVYSKPYLIVESFQLNATVAAGCSIENLADVIGFAYEACEHSSGYFASYASCSSGLKELEAIHIEEDGTRTHCYHGPTSEVKSLITSG